MNHSIIPLIIVSGPVGVGKSSVANEISEQLLELGIAHTLIDFDALTQTFPRPVDDPHGIQLGNRNLAQIWTNGVEVGSLNLIIAQVVETQQDVDAIVRAIPGSKAVVFQLRASETELRARVSKREIGSGHDWHANRAVELSRSLAISGPADYVVETDNRGLTDIAGEIVQSISWRKSL